MDKFEKISDKKKVIARIIWAIAIVCIYIYFLLGKSYLFKQDLGAESVGTLKVLMRIGSVTVIALFGLAVNFWQNKWSAKANRVIAVAMFLLTPFVCFTLLEYAGVMNSRLPWDVIGELGWMKYWVTIAILLFLLIGFYLLAGSVKAAVVIVSVFLAIFGVANYFVYDFRGMPFLASDLSIVGTAVNVMGGYQYFVEFRVFMLIMGTLLWCLMICRTERLEPLKLKIRIPALAVYVLLFGFAVHTFVFTEFMDEKLDVRVGHFRPDKSYRRQGTVLCFIASFRQILIEKPEGYDVDELKALAAEYTQDDGTEHVKPNVIAIMDEAFADFNSIADIATNEEVLPVINSLTEDTVKGTLYVSVFGGKTSNTEYEFLTGNTEAFMPLGATPYQTYVKKAIPSLTTLLKEQGYQGNLAIHPFKPNGYNRSSVYTSMGFETFLSQDDFVDPKRVRKYISDEADMQRIVEEYERVRKDTDEPFYLFNVTMQNHTPYDEDWDNLPLEIEITDEQYQDEEAQRYLNLVHLSDQALGNLIDYFKQVEEPTIIVFFGDHQPQLPDSFYDTVFSNAEYETEGAETLQKYQVPYIIWANYDIEEKTDEDISVNYLSTLMAETAGMEMSGYQKFLQTLKKEVPIITANGCITADGQYYESVNTEPACNEMLATYRKLQYNYMFDNKKRLENFF